MRHLGHLDGILPDEGYVRSNHPDGGVSPVRLTEPPLPDPLAQQLCRAHETNPLFIPEPHEDLPGFLIHHITQRIHRYECAHYHPCLPLEARRSDTPLARPLLPEELPHGSSGPYPDTPLLP